MLIKRDACRMPLPSFRVIFLRPHSGLLFLRPVDTLVRHKTDYVGFRVVLVRRAVDKHFEKVRRLAIVFSLKTKFIF